MPTNNPHCAYTNRRALPTALRAFMQQHSLMEAIAPTPLAATHALPMPQSASVPDVARLQQLIRTTMRALAASTLRTHPLSPMDGLIARAHALNESLARHAEAGGDASAHLKDAAAQTRSELATWSQRANQTSSRSTRCA